MSLSPPGGSDLPTSVLFGIKALPQGMGTSNFSAASPGGLLFASSDRTNRRNSKMQDRNPTLSLITFQLKISTLQLNTEIVKMIKKARPSHVLSAGDASETQRLQEAPKEPGERHQANTNLKEAGKARFVAEKVDSKAKYHQRRRGELSRQ